MPASLIPSFLVYCYVGAITPGPANICSLSAALRYGRGPALRQWRGIFIGGLGVAVAAAVVTYFLGTLLNEYVVHLSWVGAAYLLWMAWHMLRSSDKPIEQEDRAHPTFRTGLLIQATNVKVIVYCLTTLSSYVLPYDQSFKALFLMSLFLPFTGPLCNLLWLFAGASLQKLFAKHRKPVDIVMASSLALCAVSLVWPH